MDDNIYTEGRAEYAEPQEKESVGLPLNRQDEELEAVFETLGMLERRLTPVLQPEAPTNPSEDPSALAKDSRPKSPSLVQIERHIRLLQDLNAKINYITHRLVV